MMKKTNIATLGAVGIGFLTSQGANAGGFDGSGQFISPLFEPGNYVELSYGSVQPTVQGTYSPALGGGSTGDVGSTYSRIGGAYKSDLSEKLSVALIFDQPWRRTIKYNEGALAGLDGEINSAAMTILLRYKINNRFSVYGGPRVQRVWSSLETPLPPNASYELDSDPATDVGFTVGAAFEIPEYAVLVALSYNSELKQDLETTESLTSSHGTITATNDVKVTTPDSLNLEFRAPISRSTLVFGSIRHTFWDGVVITPPVYELATSEPIISYHNDTTTLRLGVGQKINDNWSVFGTFAYEDAAGEEQTALGPTDGFTSFGAGATYTTKNNLEITAALSYVTVGGTTGDIGEFDDGHVWAGGVKIAYTF